MKYTIEIHQIYEIEVEAGEDWDTKLDQSQRTYWADGKETDGVVLLHTGTEVLDEKEA